MATTEKYFDNPENLSSLEISNKMVSLGHGHNRNKRFWLISDYSTTEISKEEYIKKYTHK